MEQAVQRDGCFLNFFEETVWPIIRAIIVVLYQNIQFLNLNKTFESTKNVM